MSADDVTECAEVARRLSWIRPTVYEGLYNAISRTAETGLLRALRELGIQFHAYNPLAGGAFAPGFGQEKRVQDGSRFDKRHRQGQEYRDPASGHRPRRDRGRGRGHQAGLAGGLRRPAVATLHPTTDTRNRR